jgi:hypothetical protein
MSEVVRMKCMEERKSCGASERALKLTESGICQDGANLEGAQFHFVPGFSEGGDLKSRL